MAGPSRKEGLRCKKSIEKGRLMGKECPNLLLEEHPEFGFGIRCDNKDCGKFHTLSDLLGELRKQGKLEAVLAKLEPAEEKRRQEMSKVRVIENQRDVKARELGKLSDKIEPIIKRCGWQLLYPDSSSNREILMIDTPEEYKRLHYTEGNGVGADMKINLKEKSISLSFQTAHLLDYQMPLARKLFDQLVKAAHKISDKTGYEVEVQAPDYILKKK